MFLIRLGYKQRSKAMRDIYAYARAERNQLLCPLLIRLFELLLFALTRIMLRLANRYKSSQSRLPGKIDLNSFVIDFIQKPR